MRGYKNRQLVNILNSAVDHMCYGIGTKRVKLFLNTKIKAGDTFAFLLRELLECETLNINAKKYFNTRSFDYRESYYTKKHECVNNLVKSLIKDNPENVSMYYEESDVRDTMHIIYFEHPSFGQVSFHCDINRESLPNIIFSADRWDGLVNSTINKLERVIWSRYGEELKVKYNGICTAYEKKVKEKEKKKAKKAERKERRKIAIENTALLLKEDVKNVFNIENPDGITHHKVAHRLSFEERCKITETIISKFTYTRLFDFPSKAYVEAVAKIKEENKDYLLEYIDKEYVIFLGKKK